MFDLAVGFAIAGILMVVEYFICTRLNNALWGGIIPILILIGTVWIFVSGKVPLEIKTIFPFIKMCIRDRVRSDVYVPH